MLRGTLLTLAFLSMAALSVAGPITGEEAKRQAQVLDDLKSALKKESKAAVRFELIGKAMKGEVSPDLRNRLLDLAASENGPEIESFLTTQMAVDEDSGIRSQMATLLGKRGSEKSLAVLLHYAEKDKISLMVKGCIGGQSSARRSSIFAIAELAGRYPKIADEAAAKLRSLPVKEDPEVRDNLADARNQALYQITREEALIAPFFQKLKSKEATERVNGIVAFRFLKLSKAPIEVVETLKDADPSVRRWSALVLGEIGDPKTADVLLATANNAKEDVGVRCNAIDSIGRMKIPATAGPIEKLLMDADERVQTIAAIALYRITGKKVKQFPAGYNAD